MIFIRMVLLMKFKQNDNDVETSGAIVSEGDF